eukprot:s556_g21.t1
MTSISAHLHSLSPQRRVMATLPPAASGRRVVIFDVGGVVAESPIVAIRDFCRERKLDDLNRFLFSSKAWHSLERAQMAFRDFPEAALKECQQRGIQDGVNLGVEGWRELLQIIRGVANLRPVMLQAIQRLRQHGFVVAALTNNFAEAKDPSAAAALARFRTLFDHFIESSASKMRKPEPGFYQLALDTIGCSAQEAIFLDDIGKNLKLGFCLCQYLVWRSGDVCANGVLHATRQLLLLLLLLPLLLLPRLLLRLLLLLLVQPRLLLQLPLPLVRLPLLLLLLLLLLLPLLLLLLLLAAAAAAAAVGEAAAAAVAAATAAAAVAAAVAAAGGAAAAAAAAAGAAATAAACLAAFGTEWNVSWHVRS